MAGSLIRVSQRETLTRLEAAVRARAAAGDEVFVLAGPREFRQKLSRLEKRLRCEPAPGCSVKMWGRPGGGGILAICAVPFWGP